MLVIVAVWATTEYQNAHDRPTSGLSQSSGIPDVWNIWIIYPAIPWAFLTSVYAWPVFLRKPISGARDPREIDRQAR